MIEGIDPMKTIIRFSAIAALALGLAIPLSAAVTISVDMDATTPGIQSTRTAGAGETFTVELVMTVDAAGVSSYGISANFDTTELSLNGAPASTELLPVGFTVNLNAGVNSESPGQVRTFEATTLSNGPVSTSFVIGRINFTAPSPVTDGTADITLGFFNVGVDGCYDNAGNPVVPTFVSGKVDLLPLIITSIADSGAGTLRNVLAEAANRSSPDTITFDPALSGGTATLASEIVVNDAGGVTLDATSLPGGFTIHGGPGTNRIFTVASGTALNLASLTLTGGNGTGAAESGFGGAIENQGTLTLTRCTLSGNSAATGGGAIDNFNGTLTLTDCTILGNSTPGNGGAVYDFGTATLTHSTVSGNSSSQSTGGGVYVGTGKALTLNNSIVAGNSLTGGGTGADIRNNGTATVNGANIVQSFAGTAASGTGTLNNSNPLVAPLDNYGGPTQTMALMPGSPARNASVGSTATSDQRGFPIVGTPDIGAYEAGTFTNYNAWIWETLPATATIAQHASTFDFDGDSTNNGNEFIALTNPSDPTSVFRITNIVPSGTNVGVTFPSVIGRNYTLESTTDFTAWTLIPGSNRAGTGAPITVTIGPFTGISNLFVRGRVGP